MLNIPPGWLLPASATTPRAPLVEAQSPPTGHLRASHRETHSAQRSSQARQEPRSQSPDPRSRLRELGLRQKAPVPYRALNRGPSSRLNISASTPGSARVRARAALRCAKVPRHAARKHPSPRWAKVPRRTARKRPHPAARKFLAALGESALTPPRESALTPRSDSPSLPVEPGLVDVPFGHPEAFGHLPGRVFGPHTGIDQGADFAEVVLRGGLDLGGAREHQRQLPAQSCGGRLPQRADGPAQSLLVGLREFAADAHRA